MRLIIDLQGAQGLSRLRGIGRLSRELALAMVRDPGPHEPVVLLNEAMPDSAELLADRFARLLPRANIRIWSGMTGCSYLSGSRDRRRATEVMRAQVIAGLEGDLVHVGSMVEGLNDDVVSAWPMSHRRIPLVSTFYDAIPLLWRQHYLHDERIESWYFRNLHELKHCTALLGISESSRLEAIHHLGREPGDVFNVSAGFDAAMFRPMTPDATTRAALFERYGLRENYVLFVGAGDWRKNETGLIQAYARLSPALRASHQLVIVGSAMGDQVLAEAARLGVRPAELRLLREVSDADLPSLYSLCRCFVMPSKHEGFGLPALEAMACGVAVIASNVTSLPEVVGLDEALFDPGRASDIAERLRQVLTDDSFHARLIVHGLRQAARFTWKASAARAWLALEEIRARTAVGRGPSGRRDAAVARKSTLAFVGPLPPEASGISEYARDLLPSLGEHYDLTVVTRSGSVGDPTLSSVFRVLDEATFAEVGEKFDRIVYQVGNSEFHTGILERLLPRHPGVVMLHDAYLSGSAMHTAWLTGDVGPMARTLFDSHGWPSIRSLTDKGAWQTAMDFPCLQPVFRNALGVMQHSRHASEIILRELGERASAVIRLVPFARAAWVRGDRAAARATLGIGPDIPLVCSFGIIAPTKRPLDVLEAWHAAFAADPTARLAFVGHGNRDITATLASRAGELGVGERVTQTDRVDEPTYRLWLEAADIAIQLRTSSRGETSAAIADCMAAGLALVANAHGSAAELPPDALVLLEDLADAAQIGAAVRALWQDPPRRAALAGNAFTHVRTVMAPSVVALAYRDAIEHFYTHGDAARLRAAMPDLPSSDHADAARALAISFAMPGRPRLLLDASNMVQKDLGTGIQRVLREISRRVLMDPERAVAADMVRLDGSVLRHARRFAAGMLDLPDYGLPDLPVLSAEGDILVLMDNHGRINATELAELRRLRRLGARVVVVIYDMLPLLHPEWFPEWAIPLLHSWLRETLNIADAALCISRAVADEVAGWLDAARPEDSPVRTRPLDIGWFHLGCDFSVTPSSRECDDPLAQAALAASARHPTMLMVGTVEPRKGYAQSLAAFERLWAAGSAVGLVIVGKAGWSTDGLQSRLLAHPELGRRLHWLQGTGDGNLARLYQGCTGLLMASEGEGFGLPIVEAARAGLPVLARDLPVFREIAGAHVTWFSGRDGETLAEALRSWFARAAAGTLPSIRETPLHSWDDSAAAFLAAIRSKAWPMRWVPLIDAARETPEGGGEPAPATGPSSVPADALVSPE